MRESTAENLVPTAMRIPPPLEARRDGERPRPRHALLINPFYPKDPHASFGKHVLTPTLALTSIAGGDAAGLGRSRYWDENLLQGPPPLRAVPAGRRDHRPPDVRRARLRAGALVSRARGARSSSAGCTSCRAPRRCAPHADALAIGEGVQLWPEILRDVEAGTLRAGLPRRATAGPTATIRRRAATCCRARAS